MLTPERQDLILRRLKKDGRVLSVELSRSLGVSEDTVRRDLRHMSEAGLLMKVHGGAVPRSTTKIEFSDRTKEFMPQKRAVARAAAKLIKPGSVVIFDSGTTVLEVARGLASDLRFTAVTHSPLAAAVLSELPLVEVVLVGGTVLKRNAAAGGAGTVSAYQKVRADLLLLGVCSADVQAGVTDPSLDEATLKSTLVGSSNTVVVLATADKLGKASTFLVTPVNEVDYLVTDDGASGQILTGWREAGVNVVCAAG